MKATARAHVNIALVKYWGKQPGLEKLPATGSLSLTIAPFFTETSVAFSSEEEADTLTIDGKDASEDARRRAARVLDVVRKESGLSLFARVTSKNAVPAGEGLASSASAFAALAVAAAGAAGLRWEPQKLSSLARLGSGSAARSIYGAFCWIPQGGFDHALPLSCAPSLDVSLVVARVESGPKEVSSSDGMRRTEETSPYYAAWLSSHPADLADAHRAVTEGDFALLGQVTERNALRMHAAALAADPGIVYFRGVTLEVLHALRALRKEGTPAYFTADAGAHPIALCLTKDAQKVAARMAEVPGVLEAVISPPGPAAHLL